MPYEFIFTIIVNLILKTKKICTILYTFYKCLKHCTHLFSLQYEIYINSKYKLTRHGELWHFDSNFQKKKKSTFILIFGIFKSYIYSSLLFEWNFS